MQALAGLGHFGLLLGAARREAEPTLGFVQSCSRVAQPWGCPKAGGLVSAKVLHLDADLDFSEVVHSRCSEVKPAADSWDICLYQKHALVQDVSKSTTHQQSAARQIDQN